jgi:spore germination cell wall hydrolase CwlJ-like protein
MALTMWGEARREGEIGMRAVGHVIDNRHKSGRHGAYATDTVSAAYQFSCWNEGDPNRVALDTIDRLRPDSADHRAWLAAKRIAGEILAGGSADPTGGALFYHTVAVAPLGPPAFNPCGGSAATSSSLGRAETQATPLRRSSALRSTS